jgi:hypothetical protein
MALPLRKTLLATHISISVGWIGALAAFLVLSLAGLVSQDVQTVRAAYLAMELTGWYAIVPLATASLITGIVISLGTQWGLLSHYWVMFKLVLTALATIVLLLNMPTVSMLADTAAETSSPGLGGMWSQLLHAGGGLLVLLVTTILGVYKPRGLTPYGQRKQGHRRPPA